MPWQWMLTIVTECGAERVNAQRSLCEAATMPRCMRVWLVVGRKKFRAPGFCCCQRVLNIAEGHDMTAKVFATSGALCFSLSLTALQRQSCSLSLHCKRFQLAQLPEVDRFCSFGNGRLSMVFLTSAVLDLLDHHSARFYVRQSPGWVQATWRVAAFVAGALQDI